MDFYDRKEEILRLAVFLRAKANADGLALLKELLESGKVVPVIDRRYTLEQVPEAIRYMETGRARGKVIIIMEDDV